MLKEMYEICIKDLTGRRPFNGEYGICFRSSRDKKAKTIEEWVEEYGEIESFLDKFEDEEHGHFACDITVYLKNGNILEGIELERGANLEDIIRGKDVRKLKLNCRAYLLNGTEIFTRVEHELTLEEY